MPETLARLLVAAGGVYLTMGLLFAIPFVLVWAGRLDRAARDGTVGFRVLILPGATALWPVLAWKLLRRTPGPGERNAHLDAARTLDR